MKFQSFLSFSKKASQKKFCVLFAIGFPVSSIKMSTLITLTFYMFQLDGNQRGNQNKGS